MRANQKELPSIKILRRKANQKALRKVSTKMKKNMQLMKQRTKNLWLQINYSSMIRSILTYSSAVKNFLNNLDATCKKACIATSKDKYYTKMFNTLTGYNDRKNMPWSNANIIEAICKVMEEESITDDNNATADTFSHASSAHIETKTRYL